MEDANQIVEDRFPAAPDAGPSPEEAAALEKPYLGKAPIHHVKEAPPAQIADDNAYEALKPGSKFVGPDGKTRSKPYNVASDQDFQSVPEGAQFMDPDGKLRQKPKYEGIDFTAQTLYDMAVTPKEKRKALERSYKGKVKGEDNDLYVEDEGGVYRKPGRGLNAATGFAASAALPTGGAVLGALGGGAAGSAVPGAGNVAGVVAGGASGGVLGQYFNDLILQLSGVYDRTTGEEAANLGMAGLTGGMGGGVGRGIATAVPSLKAGVSAAGNALPGVAAHFLGATGPDLQMARELADKGVMVPPSAWAHEAPHLQNLTEVFDPAFRTNKPLMESATQHYEKSAGELLEGVGVKPEGSIVKPSADVPTQKTGEAIMQRTLQESKAADDALSVAIEQRKAAVQSGLPENIAQRETLTKAAEESRKAAQSLIDQGFKDIQQNVDTATKVSGAGGNSGELWEMVAGKLQAVKRGIQERHSTWYDQADAVAGGHLPNVQGLEPIAKSFLEQLPEGFENKYPSIVKQLRDMQGIADESGEIVKKAADPTFGQLHNLRSQLRNNVNWYEISPDFKDGVYKQLQKHVDDVLHDPNAPKELQTAAQMLDATDKSYGENMRIFKDRAVRAVVKGLEGGEPADPKVLFDTVVKNGRSDLTTKVKDMVGPNLWAGVKAADVQEMLDLSKTLTPGEIDGKAFAKQVLDRHRSNMLESVHGKEASEQLLKQAQYIAALDGKLELPVRPGDTMTSLIARARATAEEAKKAGERDPLATLNKEMKRIESDRSRLAAKNKAERRNDPLGFLYDPTTGADAAVNKILGSEDLILAAAAKFGEKSPEFEMLRQVYAQRILQGTMQPSSRLKDVSSEIQQLMFPGTTLPQLKTLAKEMDFLLNTRANARGDMAGGMSAMSKVEHPIGGQFLGPLGITAGTKLIPGLDAGARATRGKFYATVTKMMTSPAFLRWVEKGLSGTAEEKEATRQVLSKVLQKGGALGAGAGEAVFQGGMQ